jgi:hypothetical protein
MSKDISEREIGLLNDLIEIPFKKTKAALNEKDPHNANQAPDILFDEKTHTMKVPFDLREKNILNVNLDPVLK